MRQHRRVNGLTQEQRAWQWLRRHPGHKPREIARALSISDRAMVQLLLRLRHKGCVTHVGYTNAVRYYAVKGKRPEDMRGTSANTMRALRAYWFPPGHPAHNRRVPPREPPKMPQAMSIAAALLECSGRPNDGLLGHTDNVLDTGLRAMVE